MISNHKYKKYTNQFTNTSNSIIRYDILNRKNSLKNSESISSNKINKYKNYCS